MESSKRDRNLIQKLKEAFESSTAPVKESPYPKEAVPLGTFARATRHDKLGVVTDAFYGEVDEVGQKIIVYTILLFPDSNPFSTNLSEQYYVSNEYEYEIIAYLMMPPVNLAALTAQLGGGLFL